MDDGASQDASGGPWLSPPDDTTDIKQSDSEVSGGLRSRRGGGGYTPRQSTSSRERMVHSFLKHGDTNPAFADKAPSILPSGSGANTPRGSPAPSLVFPTPKDTPDYVFMGKGSFGAPMAAPASSLQTPLLVHRGDTDEDFLTVDWARDRDTYLMNRQRMDQRANEGWYRTFTRSWHAMQAWVLCTVVGICTGITAALVDIAVHWAVDFKLGYCRDAFWLDYAFCCNTESDVTNPINGDCARWRTWVDVFGGSNAFWVEYSFYVLLAVVMAGTSCWLVCTFAPYASGSGIPEVKTILGGVVIKKYLGLWTLLVKCVGLVLSVGSGLALGKEGPYVHIAGCFANVFTRGFAKYNNNQAKKNEILSASAAAGVAVAFGAPIGGVLFSLEEVSTYFPHKTMWRAFYCAIVAALTLKFIDPSQTGKLVLFQIDYDITWQWFEILPFALLGVLGGIIGVFFIRMNLRLAKLRKFSALGKHPILEIMAVAGVSAIINYNSNFLRGSQNSILALLFQECNPDEDPLNLCPYTNAATSVLNLFLTAVATLCLTIFTFGTKVPAGLFIPSMVVGAQAFAVLMCTALNGIFLLQVTGACVGRILGTMIRTLQHENPHWGIWDCTSLSHCITPGIYSLVGAAAVLGGVTRMTVSLVVIMFELTGGLNYILPIMVGIIFSKWVGDAFGKHGIYDRYIALHGYPFLEDVESIPISVRAEDVMTKEPMSLTMHGHTVEDLYQLLNILYDRRINGFPVVTSTADMLVVGYITRSELQAGLEYNLKRDDVTRTTRCYFAMLDMRFPKNAPHVDLRPWLHPTPIQVVENTPLHRIYNAFTKLGLRYALVTRFGKLVGIITKKDIHRFFKSNLSH